MREYPLTEKQEEINQHIFQEALGRIEVLSAAPTATAPILKEDEIGLYSNALYARKNDVIYSFSSDSQTTITQDET